MLKLFFISISYAQAQEIKIFILAECLIRNEMSDVTCREEKRHSRHLFTTLGGGKTTTSFRSLTILLVTTLKTSSTSFASKNCTNLMTDGRLHPQDFDSRSIFTAMSSCFLQDV